MALHEQSIGATDEWFTPPYVFEALGCRFDQDVAYPMNAEPPVPADYFISKNSLSAKWRGFVWMNPPFGGRNGLTPWIEKFVEHGNGIALVPDRTSAPWWQTFAPQANLILFVQPKIRFIGPDGLPGTSPAQGTTLMAIGDRGCQALRQAAVTEFTLQRAAGPKTYPGLGMLARPLL